ncbi:MarR family winged helix-turn-helix transcriptional regulator [Streptomyces sp. BBFR51]|uniref:MarR family winged helix-turn-helix transcriptional regulator n=1 Tax=Streptomyces sp. BBFR51 TaxID=3372856 RepID=UPI0037DDAE9D
MDDARLDLDLVDYLLVLRQQVQVELRTLLRDLELTDAQADALWRLSGEGPMTARRLADRLRCDASTATAMVDRLERHGLVRRVAHPTDRRVKILELTSEGCALRERVMRHTAEHSPFARLDRDSRLRLHALLRRAAGGSPPDSGTDAPGGTGEKP